MLHAQQRAEDVGVESGRVALCCLLCYETARPLSPGIVDGHIQAAKARDGLIDQVADVLVVAYVSTPILCLSADLAEFSDQFLADFVASARDDDARTFIRESNCSSASDSRE